MSKYQIRFATLDDVDDIMSFIKLHWRSDHVLALNKSFFLYEYQADDRVNFVLGIDTQTQQIVGVCGFIKNTKQLEGSDVWGSLWKVIKTDNPMLGIQILEFIPQNTGCRTFSSLGIAPKTLPIYDFLRFTTGKLNHYYRLGNLREYKIAQVVHKEILPVGNLQPYSLKRLTHIEQISPLVFENRNRYPYKDAWYVQKRYFEHPVYQYQVWEIESEISDSILVTRALEHNQAKILRIVDFIGDANKLAHLGHALDHLIQLEGYEYVDVYNSGIQPEIFQSAGFQLRDDNDPNIIPNYFEPFVAAQADLYFFNDRNSEYFHIFKADGDQDRPNRIPCSA